MEATWRPPTTLKGLSRFLVEHEPCGAGFDVSHPAGLGSGRVSMTCRGCGATYEYATATIEFEREVEFEPVDRAAPRPDAPPPPPAPAYVAQPALAEIEPPADAGTTEKIEPEAEPSAPDTPSGKGDGPRRRLPKGWTRDRAITAGLLLFSAAALVFAVVRIIGDSSDSTNQAATTPPPAVAPAEHPKPAPATPPAHHSRTTPKPKPAKPAAPQHPAPDERVVKTNRFSVVVPANWTRRAAAGGGMLLAPPGSAQVSLQIFYEDDPGLSADKMSVQTAGFLSSRDPETAVSAAKTLRIADHPAFELSADGPAGSQAALGVIADPYRYLAIVSADPGTAKSEKDAAIRAMRSLRPR